jgi:hypothetical protein
MNETVKTIPADPKAPVSIQPKTDAETKILMKGISCWQFWFPIMNLARSFLYDIPMILSTPLKLQMGIADSNIQYLYSAFYLPPIFFNPIYGAIQKVYGPKTTYLALGSMCIGHVLFVIGIYTQEYWLLFLGRVFIGGGGEGTLISQVYTITYYSEPEQKMLMISLCKTCARVALIICYYFMPALYLWTGEFVWPMLLTSAILILAVFALWLYLMYAEKYSTVVHTATENKPFRLVDLKSLGAKYYILLLVRFCVMGAWFGFSALFMQYLEAGCGMGYEQAAHYILVVPFVSLSVVCLNIVVNKHCDTLEPALLICSFAVSVFLWVSGFYVEKGTGMAIFAIIVISISGGYFNVCIDTFLSRMNPGMSSVGTAISMSVKGVSCLIFPLVNGLILGQNATKESIAKCCMFMAVPCSIGFLLIVGFIMIKPKPTTGKNFCLRIKISIGETRGH